VRDTTVSGTSEVLSTQALLTGIMRNCFNMFLIHDPRYYSIHQRVCNQCHM